MAKLFILKISRLESLTDGIFAIAMTILIFNLHIPSQLREQSLWTVLSHDTFEKLGIYAGSFIILGTQWIGTYFQLGFLERVNRIYLWFNVFWLMLICIVPFSASLLVDYPDSPISISFYAVNLILVTLSRFFCWEYACHFKLNHPSHPIASRSIVQRLIMAPVFYMAAPFVAYWNTHFAFVLLIAPPLIHLIPGKVDQYLEQDV